jgi:hypothetical protein
MPSRWVVIWLAASLALTACGSSGVGEGVDGGTPSVDGGGSAEDGGARDGGATPVDGGSMDGGARDGGTPHDAGTPPDGGTPPDAGTKPDGGPQCMASGCANIAGTYQGCLNCGLLGTFGPAEVDVTQDGCLFHACIPTDGGPQCAEGCVDARARVSFTINYNGTDVTCSGPFNSANHSIDLTCPVGVGSCSATLLPSQPVCQ